MCVFIVKVSIPGRFSTLHLNCPQVFEFTLSQSHLLSGEKAEQFSAAVAIHIISIFVPTGTYYHWMDRSGDSKLAQGFYT